MPTKQTDDRGRGNLQVLAQAAHRLARRQVLCHPAGRPFQTQRGLRGGRARGSGTCQQDIELCLQLGDRERGELIGPFDFAARGGVQAGDFAPAGRIQHPALVAAAGRLALGGTGWVAPGPGQQLRFAPRLVAPTAWTIRMNDEHLSGRERDALVGQTELRLAALDKHIDPTVMTRDGDRTLPVEPTAPREIQQRRCRVGWTHPARPSRRRQVQCAGIVLARRINHARLGEEYAVGVVKLSIVELSHEIVIGGSTRAGCRAWRAGAANDYCRNFSGRTR